MLRLLVVVAAVALAACPAAQKVPDKVPTAAALPSLAGKFASGCLAQPAADGTTNYVLLTTEFAPATFVMDLVMFGEETCATKQGTMHYEGSYVVTGASTAVPGAFDGDFTYAKRTITPHVDGFIALMQSMSCGKAPYAVNQPQDVHVDGCKDFGMLPIAQCPKVLDIVKIEGDGSLRLGKRSGEACSPQRPTTLDELVLKPVN